VGNRGSSIVRRQKERARQERKKAKIEKKAQRSAERRERPAATEGDPDIAGIVAGPQPPRED
jgi:hypothetical protein